MLKKMGFQEGKGLGKDQQGPVNPLLPEGQQGREGMGFTVHKVHDIAAGVPEAPFFQQSEEGTSADHSVTSPASRRLRHDDIPPEALVVANKLSVQVLSHQDSGAGAKDEDTQAAGAAAALAAADAQTTAAGRD
jgi:hypothetical protein